MATCEKCGSSFNLSREDERLVLRGLLASVCDTCTEASRPKIGDWKPAVKEPVRIIDLSKLDDLAQAELIEAMVYDPKGRIVTLMRRPKHFNLKPQPLAKPKLMNVPPTVISETMNVGTTTPSIRLQTNLLNFRHRKRTFWIQKIPSFDVDAYTGTARIEVDRKFIKSVQRTSKTEVTLNKTDGGKVYLLFEFVH